ncbi:hypothetical protein [Silvibacterium sp.]|uniref:hypothetical protein n=1 Tax=Silvibacterium sp. TaxID=1964179 RepID=UPI0039E5CE30
MSEREKSSVSEMIGEFVREIAVLVIVFVPLEAYKDRAWPVWELIAIMVTTVLIGIGILALGIAIERRRP